MEDKLFEEQKKIIMNRIHDYEDKKRKNFKPIILVAAVLLIFMIPLFSNSSTSFGITQINANEYTLDLFGDKVHFKLYALMENQNKIPINDDMAYYKGFQKYFDVTSKFKIETIEIEGYLFLKMMQGDEVISYLYVDNYDEHTRSVNLIDREFSDFETEMREIIENVKAYPYDITLETERGPLVEENEKADELDETAREGYRWFKGMQVRVWSSEPIDEYEVVLYLDEEGKLDKVGHSIGRYSEDLPIQFKVAPSSYLGGEEEVNGVKISSYKYLFENVEGMAWLSAMKIDFGTLNPDDYEVEVKVNDTVVAMQWELIDENILYLASELLPFSANKESLNSGNEAIVPVKMHVQLFVVDKLNGDVLVEYEDYNSMSLAIECE